MTDTNSIDFFNEISQFVFYSKYSRFNDALHRRETWDECVNRVMRMHLSKYKTLPKEDLDAIRAAFQMVKEKKVVPSMRSMQFGGKAIMAHNAKLYNCCLRHVDSIRALSEIMYLLLCGCGVGFGVQKAFINRLPDLVDASDKTGTVLTYVIQDSIEGWSDSIEALLMCYFRNTPYSGRKISFDYSRIRPEGAVIKTGGGKAPGYKGLKNAHKKIKQLLDTIIEEEGCKRLRPIHAYDIVMHSSDAVLSGGVRRSATICVFDADDDEMAAAKTYFKVIKHTKGYQDDSTKKWHCKVTLGNKKQYEVELTEWEYNKLQEDRTVGWNHIEPQRARSNNSAVLIRNKVTFEQFQKFIEFTKQWGEPGFIFADDPRIVINPCGEVACIPITEDGVCGVQFCNLTSVNGAKIKTKQDFLKAVEAASLIGTLQAGYTDFKYLSNAAKIITEGEALLGVSITGMMDNPEINLSEEVQKEGALLVVETNKQWAQKLGIKQAARATCIKPEGTGSWVLGTAAQGIHANHASRFFRRIQCNKQETLYQFFKENNPHMCEESVWSNNHTDDVVTFPITVPDGAIVKADLSAIEHLKLIQSTQKNWVNFGTSAVNKLPITHSVSCTVLVKDDTEWNEVVTYLYNNRQSFSTVSLLTAIGDKLYKQAPNEAVVTPEDEEKWKNIVENYKKIDYKEFHEYEDTTKLMESAACVGGQCDIF